MPGVGEARCGNHRGRFVEIGIVHDDHRRIAPQFQRYFLDAGHFADRFADFEAPRKTDLADPFVGANRLADFRTPSGDARDRLRRQPRCKQDFDQLQGRQRRVAGRFDDHRIAGRDGRADFVRHQIERKVKGRDGRHDAARDAQREPEFPCGAGSRVEGDDFGIEPFGFVGRDVDRFSCPAGFEHSFGENLPFFGADRASQLFLPFEHQTGGPAEDLAALIGRHTAHGGRPARERGEGLVDIGSSRLGNGVDDGPIERIGHRDFFGTILPFAA